MNLTAIKRAAFFMALMWTSGPALAAPDGKTVYQRCAACHLPTGLGVPGMYPPLTQEPRKLATMPDGRRYLVLTITRGLMGPLSVDGKIFRGVMPAQAGLDDAAIAAVLNYVTATLGSGGTAPMPFTAAEVESLRASGATMAPADLAKLHEGLIAK